MVSSLSPITKDTELMMYYGPDFWTDAYEQFCSVCLGTECTDANPLILCDGVLLQLKTKKQNCMSAVHVFCSTNTARVDAGPYYCDGCVLRRQNETKDLFILTPAVKQEISSIEASPSSSPAIIAKPPTLSRIQHRDVASSVPAPVLSQHVHVVSEGVEQYEIRPAVPTVFARTKALPIERSSSSQLYRPPLLPRMVDHSCKQPCHASTSVSSTAPTAKRATTGVDPAKVRVPPSEAVSHSQLPTPTHHTSLSPSTSSSASTFGSALVRAPSTATATAPQQSSSSVISPFPIHGFVNGGTHMHVKCNAHCTILTCCRFVFLRKELVLCECVVVGASLIV